MADQEKKEEKKERRPSAERAERVALVHETRNRTVKSAVSSRVVAARKALQGTDKTAIGVALTATTSQLDRAAAKDVIHRNKAARIKSRLAKKLNITKKK